MNVLREEKVRKSYKKAVRKRGGNKYAVDDNGKEVILSVVTAQKGIFGRITDATTVVTDRTPMEPAEGILYSRSHALSVKQGVDGRDDWGSVETITTVEHGKVFVTPIVDIVHPDDIEWHTRLLKSVKRGDVIIYDTGNPEVDGKTKREIKATKRGNK